MNKDYFRGRQGFGVLSTASREGMTNMAVYAHPVVLDERRLAFVMGHHRSYAHLKDNPHASYLFREDGPGFEGCRLYLKMMSEESEPQAVDRFRKEHYPETYSSYRDKPLSVVIFQLLEERPLVGDTPAARHGSGKTR